MKAVQRCHICYPFICKYFDEIYAVKEQCIRRKACVSYLLRDCIICAEAAYRENGKEEYKIAYRRYKKLLDEEIR